jgi:transcriptional regulator with XRE-family HTH domain
MEINYEQNFQPFDKVRCFSCGALRNIEELGECRRCHVLVCGSPETNCKAMCPCDSVEARHMPGRFAEEFNRLIDTDERRLSTYQLAAELGLTYEFVRKLRRGLNLPTEPTLILISKLFDVQKSVLEEWVKQSKLAKEYSPGIAGILFDPARMTFVSRVSMLDDKTKDKIFWLVERELEALGYQHRNT